MRSLVTAISMCLLVTACEGRPRSDAAPQDDEPRGSRDEPHLAEIDLREGAPELAEAALFGPAEGRSYADLVLALRDLESEENAKAAFVRLGAASMSLARAGEAGRLLARWRGDDARAVVCHADTLDNATMLLAARGCSEIWVSPAGHVETVGIAAQLVFVRSLLEELHVQVDFLQVGKYKGAEEPFTRNEPSPEARASLESTLRGLRAAWMEGIAEGRGVKAAELELERGPHTPEVAKALGLVDAVGYEAEARKRAAERAGVEPRVSYFGEREPDDDGIAGLVRLLSGTRSMAVPHVAVVPLSGAISLTGGSPLTTDRGIEERELGRAVRRLRDDPSVKAVVLRIDSPGGSALASDLLWRALMDLRAAKPVVASIGSMAASGGYYLAAAANEIVAEPESIVGSIGVVAGKLSFAQSLEAIGVYVEPILADPSGSTRALYGSPLSSWDEETREKMRESIEQTYDLFLSRVAEGRGLERSTIDPAAEGRIMAGRDGKKAKLVDELGGLDRALARAFELARLDAETPVHVVRMPSGLLALLGVDSPEARAAAAVEREAARRASRAVTEALLPWSREIDRFAGTLVPLLQGEHVLAALPFALSVR